jgi:uncharacterized protein YggT (Ycf19 family)
MQMYPSANEIQQTLTKWKYSTQIVVYIVKMVWFVEKKNTQIGTVANTNEAPPLKPIKSLNSSKLELHSIDWYPLLPLR